MASPSSGSSPSVVSTTRLHCLDSERERSLLRDLVWPESSVSDMLDVTQGTQPRVTSARPK